MTMIGISERIRAQANARVQRADIIRDTWTAIMFKYGPAAAIGLYLVYHSAAHQDIVAEQTLNAIKSHRAESAYVQHSSCISLAVLAGTPKEMCEIPIYDEAASGHGNH